MSSNTTKEKRRYQSNHDRDIHTVEDGQVALLCAINAQSKIDKKYFDQGKAPPGSDGAYYTKDGAYRRAKVLEVDPIKEYEESEAEGLLDLARMVYCDSGFHKISENRNYIAYNYF